MVFPQQERAERNTAKKKEEKRDGERAGKKKIWDGTKVEGQATSLDSSRKADLDDAAGTSVINLEE